jgi:hypothetical protein
MKKAKHPTQSNGATSYIGDCYVWAEIYYLDSTSDYREFLTQQSQSELVMLDDITPSPLWVVFNNLEQTAISLAAAFANIVRRCFRIQR